MKKLLFNVVLSFSSSILGYSQDHSNDFALTKKTQGACILILGNSITYHKEKPSIGWYGNWGMAASSEEKDFVHIIKAKLLKQNSSAKIHYGNIANSFERKFWSMDTSEILKFGLFSPDVTILKIGENIKDDLAEQLQLPVHLKKLVRLIDPVNASKVIIAGSFWPNKIIESQFKKACKENNWIYVSLDGLYNDKKNTAFNNYSNFGVGRHPSDEGMKNIAEKIWEPLVPFLE